MLENLLKEYQGWQGFILENYLTSNGQKGLSPNYIKVENILKQKLNESKQRRKKKSEEIDNDAQKNSIDFSWNKEYNSLKKLLSALADKMIYIELSKSGELKIPLFYKIMAAHYNNSKISLSTKSPKRRALAKDYNAYTVKIRSAYKTIVKNVERFSEEPMNIKMEKELEDQLRKLFPKRELINIFMATWLQNHTSFTKNQTMETIKSLIFAFPVLVFFTGETTRSQAVGIKEEITKKRD